MKLPHLLKTLMNLGVMAIPAGTLRLRENSGLARPTWTERLARFQGFISRTAPLFQAPKGRLHYPSPYVNGWVL